MQLAMHLGWYVINWTLAGRKSVGEPLVGIESWGGGGGGCGPPVLSAYNK